jgi:hypothetical protein
MTQDMLLLRLFMKDQFLYTSTSYVLTYKPAGKGKAGALRAGENIWHKIHVELRPKEKFAGYEIPYYKRCYNRKN